MEKMAGPDIHPEIGAMRRGIEVLKALQGTEGEVQAFKGLCRGRVPLAGVFSSKEEVEARRAKEVNGTAEANGVKADV